ncbi:related to Sexual differentiation process protein isp4 [Saccharomycodes ludwigii]|uniref:Related to Sexual differentiation process protein isp4 n=1 Tax=Saccharomycodes ludwigii TaxID=36035 RepID=A0A376B419_9ASCO|nr:hypothetical protein SCDLUD_000084 [Saccharomycodes ludwigii]KAH3902507.1 hypothetical protein SCDLUD_000084 [Saccharomycodes ludwigii]SSD59423.1 related to Sexual differentiation process protein isp4 [Saccharomycodes ludwigii]
MDKIKKILSSDAPITDKELITPRNSFLGDAELNYGLDPAASTSEKKNDKILVEDNELVDGSANGNISEYDVEKGVLNAVVSQMSSSYDPLAQELSGEIVADEYAGVTVEDDSPYPEVRAAVPSTDDPTIPQNTLRMWVLGILMTMIGSALNLLFSMHSPSIVLTSFVTSILAWPIGRCWEKIVPDVRLFGKYGGPRLNPGPFNIKEHTLITIMGNVSFGGGNAYATDILLALHNFYHKDFGVGFDILAILSTQCLGFAMAGMVRKILVSSPSMIWPSNLVSCTFLTNMHINENHVANGWRISRLKFFLIVFIAGFVWYWFPGYIFQALSYFGWVTWIRPNNTVLNQVFGVSTGLGLIPITFDWNQIAGYIGSPLVPPISVIFTTMLSVVVIFWAVVPAIHYSSVWYGKYLPISDSSSYDRFQQTYNSSKIVNSDLSLNLDAYKKYSPLYLSATFAISYGMSFASTTATVVHAFLFHGKQIYNQVRNMKTEKKDIHAILMERNYKECPTWWYMVVFLVFFALAIATIRAWNTEMPVYSLVVALLIALFFLLPIGIIYALTNIAVGLNVITEFIVGFMVPGKPVAMMFFKTFGYITNNQAITFAQDQKLGHYMKIAPRLLFVAQFIASIWGALVQIAVQHWAYGAIDDLCSETQKDRFTCPNGRVFYNASLIWGCIGPQRMFVSGQLYNKLLWFFLLGAGLPFVNWSILKKWPNHWIKYCNWPVFFSATGYIPPATPYNYTTYCIVGMIFGYFIKKRWYHWWAKYNYSLSAGLDISLAWSSLIIFLCLYLTNAPGITWWGNDVLNETTDMLDTAIQVTLPDGQWFGRDKW